MSDKCDSTHEGNGRPGNGIIFQAAEKLLLAVSTLMDTCGERGIDSSRALAAVKRRENQLIDASARHDAKVSALRERLAAANAKLAEMARLAEDSAKAANELTGVGWWRPIETAPKDGRAVLLHNNIAPGNPSGRMGTCEGYNTVVGEWWSSDEGDRDANGFGDWMCYMDAIEDPRCPFDPTHWMPLPQPPKEADDDDA